MATPVFALDEAREAKHQECNRQQTQLLVVALAAFLALAAYSFMGLLGVVLALAFTAVLWFVTPRVAPDMVMQLFRAVPIDPRGGAQLYRIRDQLVARAELPTPPDLYVVPSLALNAFSVGRPERSAIAVTEGLLRKLDAAEIQAVLAHELAHIKNDDLSTLGFADVLTRVLQILSWAAIGILIYHLPSIFTGDYRAPWLGMLLLYLGPTFGSLLQLALSRVREFDADLDAVTYTGDPEALARALSKIEHHTGQALEDLLPPGTRRVPMPSLLRSHPETADRVKRLRDVSVAIAPLQPEPAETLVTLAGVGPASMRPRYRLPGVWF